MSGQAAFAAALLADRPRCPDGLRTWNGSDPAPRFAVYRNNVIVSLIDALADAYPVTRALVGDEFFHAMARAHARAHPPRTPVLARYGADFADFVAAFGPAASLPYLPDVARLEWLYVLAFHAADADPLAMDRIAVLLADPDRLRQTRFVLHPSFAVLQSAYAVASLWAAHRDRSPLSAIDPASGEAALVRRNGLQVEILHLDRAAAEFIAALRQGRCLGDAADAALSLAADFDLAGCLGLLIRSGAIIAIN